MLRRHRWAVGFLVLALVAAGIALAVRGGEDTHRPEVVSLNGAESPDDALARRDRERIRERDRNPDEQQRRPSPAREATPKPSVEQMPIPFGAKRKAEMRAYAQRHYGIDSYRLRNPKVIVEHTTQGSDVQSAFDIFASDVPDQELHELPGTCAHFVIDSDGAIYQLVPLEIMCRHTVGLNYTSVGVEHVGFSDQQVLSNSAQMRASITLTNWLRCRFDISVDDVIGHNESLKSRYHQEQVARLRTQTHDDFKRASMRSYRARLGDC